MPEHESGDFITRRRGERRHLSITEATLIAGMLFQAGMLVWGAAKLTTTVDNLAATAVEIKTEQKQQGNMITQLRVDVTAIKTQVNK